MRKHQKIAKQNENEKQSVKQLQAAKNSAKRKRKYRSFKMYKGMSRYILRIFAEIDNQRKISNSLMKVLTSVIFDQACALFRESVDLERIAGKQTLRSKTVDYAIQLMFKRELKSHMLSKAKEAAHLFASNSKYVTT